MKKLALLLASCILLLAISGGAFAQSWEGNVHQGDFAAFVGVGLGWGFTIAPGVEWVFADVKFGGTVPVAFGVTGKGVLNFYTNYFTAYGLGALATAHLGLKGLDIPEFLQNLDFYISAGVAFSFFNYDSGSTIDYGSSRVGFATSDGVAYCFNDHWAVYLEGNYFNYAGGGAIGARYTF